jgi:putative transposase
MVAGGFTDFECGFRHVHRERVSALASLARWSSRKNPHAGDRNDDLSMSRQAKVLGISRGSVYYLPRLVSADDLALMRRIDELHLDYPFAGSRMLQTFLVREGYDVGRPHVARLMKRMGVEAIYRRPNTSKPAPGPVSPARAAGDAAQSGLGGILMVRPIIRSALAQPPTTISRNALR